MCRAGATPVLVDCADDGTYLIDSAAVAAAVTPRTRAIIPVHLYGQAAPVEQLMPLAERIGGWVVEDAAQSQGARRHGAGAGALGHAAATSFYPGQEPGRLRRRGRGADRLGRAGRPDADDPEPRLAAEVRARRARASTAGWTRLQAVVLSAKLRRLAGWNAARAGRGPALRHAAGQVDEIVLPRTLDGNEHVWHLYVVRVPDRDRVLKELQAAGIGAGIHYPVPVHRTAAFAGLGYPEGTLPGHRAGGRGNPQPAAVR